MENTNLSDKSREALKSGAWTEMGAALRQEVVAEYLQTGYADGEKEHEIQVSGITYKVLDRGEITTFYDSLGNTLFSVENMVLEDRYGEVKNEITPRSKEEDAAEKLNKELKAAKDNVFAEPIITHLLDRLKESESLAVDICQEHKTWDKCFDYIYAQAMKRATGSRLALFHDDLIYEWAEDYYRKDDKADEEKKAKQAAERKKKEAERKKKAAEQKTAERQKTEKRVMELAKKSEEKENTKKKKDMEGQLDMFSMMGL